MKARLIKLGLATTAAGGTLAVLASAAQAGYGWSDVRLKHDVRTVEDPLTRLRSL